MRSAINIFENIARKSLKPFEIDPTLKDPVADLEPLLGGIKRKEVKGTYCIEEAKKNYLRADIKMLVQDYWRCLPLVFQNELMSTAKTTQLIQYLELKPISYLRFWKGLLDCYFSFNKDSFPEGGDNWRSIRRLLKDNLSFFNREAAGKRKWVNYLIKNEDLLTDRPGKKLAKASLSTTNNKSEEIRSELKNILNVPGDSWLWSEYFVTKIKIAIENNQFEGYLDNFIKELEQLPSVDVRNNGIKLLLDTYQQKGLGVTEHEPLLDLAISNWKPPYKDVNIDWVRVSEATYNMVVGWYTKKRLQEFIAELRGSNGVMDDRLDFWVNYSTAIGGRFFILLGSAFRKAPRFNEIAKKYTQNFGALSGSSSANNNAFIFDFKSLYAVVFSENGNALYFYNKQNFPLSLLECSPEKHANKKSISIPNVELSKLKDQTKVNKLSVKEDAEDYQNHLGKRIVQDVNQAWKDEAKKFLISRGIYPDDPKKQSNAVRKSAETGKAEPIAKSIEIGKTEPIATSVETNKTKLIDKSVEIAKAKLIAKSYGLEYEDLTVKSGNHWIYIKENHSSFRRVQAELEKLGFKHRADKGFWKK